VSVDGGPNEVFQDYRINQGQFERLLEGESAVVPAVMLLDTFTNEHHWVSFGLISQDELASRIHRIVSNIEGEGEQ
jgi:conjugal transfer pilus assembly protein TraF